MRYQPNFCNNCGEKIERANKSFTDSKQFCDVCKHDFVLQRVLPLAFAGLMAIVGIFGIGSYWRSGEKPLNASTREFTANSGKNPPNNASQVSSNSSVQQTAPANNVQTNKPQTANLTTKAQVKRTETAPVAAETVYFCGAPTKKGTPCSRRVKGGGRCWQHQGQSAMLPPEKLLAGQ
jgi:hypothetical protein